MRIRRLHIKSIIGQEENNFCCYSLSHTPRIAHTHHTPIRIGRLHITSLIEKKENNFCHFSLSHRHRITHTHLTTSHIKCILEKEENNFCSCSLSHTHTHRAPIRIGRLHIRSIIERKRTTSALSLFPTHTETPTHTVRPYASVTFTSDPWVRRKRTTSA